MCYGTIALYCTPSDCSYKLEMSEQNLWIRPPPVRGSGAPNNRQNVHQPLMPPPPFMVWQGTPIQNPNLTFSPVSTGNWQEVRSSPPVNWQEESSLPSLKPLGNSSYCAYIDRIQRPHFHGSQMPLNFQSGPPPIPTLSVKQDKPSEASTGSFIPNQKRESDHQWLNDCLVNLENRSMSKKKQKIKLHEFGLREVQNKLLSFSNLLRELEDIVAILQDPSSLGKFSTCLKTSLVSRTEQIQVELDTIQVFFGDNSNICRIKDLISDRRNKRARKKRSDVRWRLKRQKILKSRRIKEKRIDETLERIQEAQRNKLMDEKMKLDADNILGEVRKKQQEAKEVRTLVASLDKLRQTRLNKGEAHGFVSTTERQNAFVQMAEKLGAMVNERMIQYDLEEKTLRIMMEESPIVTSMSSSSESAGKKNSTIKREMHRILFGTEEPDPDHSTSIESLIKIRSDWDQYMVHDASDLASSVPIGWVVPPSQPSQEWSHFQVAK